MVTANIRKVDGIRVVDLIGRLVLEDEVARVREVLCDLLLEENRNVLVNLEGVSSINSMGIAGLIRAATTARFSGRDVKLLKVPVVVRTLDVDRLLFSFFETFQIEEAGVASFH